MAEFFEGGLTKDQKFNNELKSLNKHYDNKIQNKSIFTSEDRIENKRSKAIKELKTEYYGNRSGGGFAAE